MTDASTLLLPNQTAVSSDCMFNLKPSSCQVFLPLIVVRVFHTLK